MTTQTPTGSIQSAGIGVASSSYSSTSATTSSFLVGGYFGTTTAPAFFNPFISSTSAINTSANGTSSTTAFTANHVNTYVSTVTDISKFLTKAPANSAYWFSGGSLIATGALPTSGSLTNKTLIFINAGGNLRIMQIQTNSAGDNYLIPQFTSTSQALALASLPLVDNYPFSKFITLTSKVIYSSTASKMDVYSSTDTSSTIVPASQGTYLRVTNKSNLFSSATVNLLLGGSSANVLKGTGNVTGSTSTQNIGNPYSAHIVLTRNNGQQSVLLPFNKSSFLNVTVPDLNKGDYIDFYMVKNQTILTGSSNSVTSNLLIGLDTLLYIPAKLTTTASSTSCYYNNEKQLTFTCTHIPNNVNADTIVDQYVKLTINNVNWSLNSVYYAKIGSNNTATIILPSDTTLTVGSFYASFSYDPADTWKNSNIANDKSNADILAENSSAIYPDVKSHYTTSISSSTNAISFTVAKMITSVVYNGSITTGYYSVLNTLNLSQITVYDISLGEANKKVITYPGKYGLYIKKSDNTSLYSLTEQASSDTMSFLVSVVQSTINLLPSSSYNFYYTFTPTDSTNITATTSNSYSFTTETPYLSYTIDNSTPLLFESVLLTASLKDSSNTLYSNNNVSGTLKFVLDNDGVNNSSFIELTASYDSSTKQYSASFTPKELQQINYNLESNYSIVTNSNFSFVNNIGTSIVSNSSSQTISVKKPNLSFSIDNLSPKFLDTVTLTASFTQNSNVSNSFYTNTTFPGAAAFLVGSQSLTAIYNSVNKTYVATFTPKNINMLYSLQTQYLVSLNFLPSVNNGVQNIPSISGSTTNNAVTFYGLKIVSTIDKTNPNAYDSVSITSNIYDNVDGSSIISGSILSGQMRFTMDASNILSTTYDSNNSYYRTTFQPNSYQLYNKLGQINIPIRFVPDNNLNVFIGTSSVNFTTQIILPSITVTPLSETHNLYYNETVTTTISGISGHNDLGTLYVFGEPKNGVQQQLFVKSDIALNSSPTDVENLRAVDMLNTANGGKSVSDLLSGEDIDGIIRWVPNTSVADIYSTSVEKAFKITLSNTNVSFSTLSFDKTSCKFTESITVSGSISTVYGEQLYGLINVMNQTGDVDMNNSVTLSSNNTFSITLSSDIVQTQNLYLKFVPLYPNVYNLANSTIFTVNFTKYSLNPVITVTNTNTNNTYSLVTSTNAYNFSYIDNFSITLSGLNVIERDSENDAIHGANVRITIGSFYDSGLLSLDSNGSCVVSDINIANLNHIANANLTSGSSYPLTVVITNYDSSKYTIADPSKNIIVSKSTVKPTFNSFKFTKVSNGLTTTVFKYNKQHNLFVKMNLIPYVSEGIAQYLSIDGKFNLVVRNTTTNSVNTYPLNNNEDVSITNQEDVNISEFSAIDNNIDPNSYGFKIQFVSNDPNISAFYSSESIVSVEADNLNSLDAVSITSSTSNENIYYKESFTVNISLQNDGFDGNFELWCKDPANSSDQKLATVYISSNSTNINYKPLSDISYTFNSNAIQFDITSDVYQTYNLYVKFNSTSAQFNSNTFYGYSVDIYKISVRLNTIQINGNSITYNNFDYVYGETNGFATISGTIIDDDGHYVSTGYLEVIGYFVPDNNGNFTDTTDNIIPFYLAENSYSNTIPVINGAFSGSLLLDPTSKLYPTSDIVLVYTNTINYNKKYFTNDSTDDIAPGQYSIVTTDKTLSINSFTLAKSVNNNSYNYLWQEELLKFSIETNESYASLVGTTFSITFLNNNSDAVKTYSNLTVVNVGGKGGCYLSINPSLEKLQYIVGGYSVKVSFTGKGFKDTENVLFDGNNAVVFNVIKTTPVISLTTYETGTTNQINTINYEQNVDILTRVQSQYTLQKLSDSKIDTIDTYNNVIHVSDTRTRDIIGQINLSNANDAGYVLEPSTLTLQASANAHLLSTNSFNNISGTWGHVYSEQTYPKDNAYFTFKVNGMTANNTLDLQIPNAGYQISMNGNNMTWNLVGGSPGGNKSFVNGDVFLFVALTSGVKVYQNGILKSSMALNSNITGLSLYLNTLGPNFSLTNIAMGTTASGYPMVLSNNYNPSVLSSDGKTLNFVSGTSFAGLTVNYAPKNNCSSDLSSITKFLASLTVTDTYSTMYNSATYSPAFTITKYSPAVNITQINVIDSNGNDVTHSVVNNNGVDDLNIYNEQNNNRTSTIVYNGYINYDEQWKTIVTINSDIPGILTYQYSQSGSPTVFNTVSPTATINTGTGTVTYIASFNKKLIPIPSNSNSYSLKAIWTPTQGNFYNQITSSTSGFNVYQANAFGQGFIYFDSVNNTTTSKLISNRSNSLFLHAKMMFDANLTAAERYCQVKFYKNTFDNANLIATNDCIIDARTNVSSNSNNVFPNWLSFPYIAGKGNYIIKALFTPLNSDNTRNTNYPIIACEFNPLTLTVRPYLSMSSSGSYLNEGTNSFTYNYSDSISREFNFSSGIGLSALNPYNKMRFNVSSNAVIVKTSTCYIVTNGANNGTIVVSNTLINSNKDMTITISNFERLLSSSASNTGYDIIDAALMPGTYTVTFYAYDENDEANTKTESVYYTFTVSQKPLLLTPAFDKYFINYKGGLTFSMNIKDSSTGNKYKIDNGSLTYTFKGSANNSITKTLLNTDLSLVQGSTYDYTYTLSDTSTLLPVDFYKSGTISFVNSKFTSSYSNSAERLVINTNTNVTTAFSLPEYAVVYGNSVLIKVSSKYAGSTNIIDGAVKVVINNGVGQAAAYNSSSGFYELLVSSTSLVKGLNQLVAYFTHSNYSSNPAVSIINLSKMSELSSNHVISHAVSSDNTTFLINLTGVDESLDNYQVSFFKIDGASELVPKTKKSASQYEFNYSDMKYGSNKIFAVVNNNKFDVQTNTITVSKDRTNVNITYSGPTLAASYKSGTAITLAYHTTVSNTTTSASVDSDIVKGNVEFHRKIFNASTTSLIIDEIIGYSPVNSSGIASLSHTFNSIVSSVYYQFYAVYGNDEDYNSATSSISINVSVVNQNASSISENNMSSLLTTYKMGDSVHLEYKMVNGSDLTTPIEEGFVEFHIKYSVNETVYDQILDCKQVTDENNGIVSLDYTFVSYGTVSFYGMFANSTNYLSSSTSDRVFTIVKQWSSQIVGNLSSINDSYKVGENVNITYTVTKSDSTPITEGVVEFFKMNNTTVESLGFQAINGDNNGVVTFNHIFTDVGSTIKLYAVFKNSVNFANSTSSNKSISIISQWPSYITDLSPWITSANYKYKLGQEITLKYKVSKDAAGETPITEGLIVFYKTIGSQTEILDYVSPNNSGESSITYKLTNYDVNISFYGAFENSVKYVDTNKTTSSQSISVVKQLSATITNTSNLNSSYKLGETITLSFNVKDSATNSAVVEGQLIVSKIGSQTETLDYLEPDNSGNVTMTHKLINFDNYITIKVRFTNSVAYANTEITLPSIYVTKQWIPTVSNASTLFQSYYLGDSVNLSFNVKDSEGNNIEEGQIAIYKINGSNTELLDCLNVVNGNVGMTYTLVDYDTTIIFKASYFNAVNYADSELILEAIQVLRYKTAIITQATGSTLNTIYKLGDTVTLSFNVKEIDDTPIHGDGVVAVYKLVGNVSEILGYLQPNVSGDVTMDYKLVNIGTTVFKGVFVNSEKYESTDVSLDTITVEQYKTPVIVNNSTLNVNYKLGELVSFSFLVKDNTSNTPIYGDGKLALYKIFGQNTEILGYLVPDAQGVAIFNNYSLVDVGAVSFSVSFINSEKYSSITLPFGNINVVKQYQVNIAASYNGEAVLATNYKQSNTVTLQYTVTSNGSNVNEGAVAIYKVSKNISGIVDNDITEILYTATPVNGIVSYTYTFVNINNQIDGSDTDLTTDTVQFYPVFGKSENFANKTGTTVSTQVFKQNNSSIVDTTSYRNGTNYKMGESITLSYLVSSNLVPITEGVVEIHRTYTGIAVGSTLIDEIIGYENVVNGTVSHTFVLTDVSNNNVDNNGFYGVFKNSINYRTSTSSTSYISVFQKYNASISISSVVQSSAKLGDSLTLTYLVTDAATGQHLTLVDGQNNGSVEFIKSITVSGLTISERIGYCDVDNNGNASISHTFVDSGSVSFYANYKYSSIHNDAQSASSTVIVRSKNATSVSISISNPLNTQNYIYGEDVVLSTLITSSDTSSVINSGVVEFFLNVGSGDLLIGSTAVENGAANLTYKIKVTGSAVFYAKFCNSNDFADRQSVNINVSGIAKRNPTSIVLNIPATTKYLDKIVVDAVISYDIADCSATPGTVTFSVTNNDTTTTTTVDVIVYLVTNVINSYKASLPLLLKNTSDYVISATFNGNNLFNSVSTVSNSTIVPGLTDLASNIATVKYPSLTSSASVVTIDKSVSVSPTNGYITLGSTNTYNLPNTSVEFWVYIDNIVSNTSAASTLKIASLSNVCYLTADGKLYVPSNNSGGVMTATFNLPITAGQWNHIMFTYSREDNYAGYVFVNGFRSGFTQSYASTSRTLTNSLLKLGENGLTAKFSNIRIWSTVITLANNVMPYKNYIMVPGILNTGLVGMFYCNEGSGNNIVDAVSGVLGTNSITGTALTFDSSVPSLSQKLVTKSIMTSSTTGWYVNGGPTISSNQMSLEFWFKSTVSADTNDLIFFRYSSNKIYGQLSKNKFKITNSDTGDSNTTTNNICDNTWHHIAITADSINYTNGLKLYVDGVLQFTINAPNIPAGFNHNTVYLMGNPPITTYNVNVTNIRTWSTMLTQTQVNFYKSLVLINTDNLIMNCLCTEGTGDTLYNAAATVVNGYGSLSTNWNGGSKYIIQFSSDVPSGLTVYVTQDPIRKITTTVTPADITKSNYSYLLNSGYVIYRQLLNGAEVYNTSVAVENANATSLVRYDTSAGYTFTVTYQDILTSPNLTITATEASP